MGCLLARFSISYDFVFLPVLWLITNVIELPYETRTLIAREMFFSSDNRWRIGIIVEK